MTLLNPPSENMADILKSLFTDLQDESAYLGIVVLFVCWRRYERKLAADTLLDDLFEHRQLRRDLEWKEDTINASGDSRP